MDRTDGDPPVVWSFFVFSNSNWSGADALVFEIHANQVAWRLFKLKKTKIFRSQEHKLRIRLENKEIQGSRLWIGAEQVRNRCETGAGQVRDTGETGAGQRRYRCGTGAIQVRDRFERSLGFERLKR